MRVLLSQSTARVRELDLNAEDDRRDLYRKALGLPQAKHYEVRMEFVLSFCWHLAKNTRIYRWRDLRFRLGYWIGDFRSASRTPR